jgi:hypothetical protein
MLDEALASEDTFGFSLSSAAIAYSLRSSFP